MPKIERSWDGGYVRTDAKGRSVYIIRRSVSGKRYEVSTRCRTERAAIEQLRRFEADPESYEAAGAVKEEGLFLTDVLVTEFLDWSHSHQKNSDEWLTKQKRLLAWWLERLKGLDLRKLTVTKNIKPALVGATSRQHRIAVLKSFYSWLRKEKHAISIAEDPTFQTLSVPQAVPQQWTEDKVIPFEDYEKVRLLLDQHWRDAMDIQAGTAWHVSEVQRFAKAGRIEKFHGEDDSVAGVLVCPQAKGGGLLRTAVSAEVLEAASRLRKRGALGREKYGLAINAACKEAGVKPFTPGRFRHSVATWAVNRGASLNAVSDFLNHKSKATTRKFYATHAVAAKIPTLR